MTTTLPAKAILFGEYLVLMGGDILSLPLPNQTGGFSINPESNSFWEGYYQFLSDISEDFNQDFDIDRLKADIVAGLHFDTTFKQRAGLGSSGVLVACLYRDYTDNKVTDTTQLLEDFSKMEAYFHGTSSGFDPLVSYLAKPILRQGDSVQVLQKLPEVNYTIVDSHAQRKDPDLVNNFLQRVSDSTGYESDINALTLLNNEIIASIVEGDIPDEKIAHFCEEEQRLFPDCFPPSMAGQPLVKLCGAGGGGYFIRFDF